MVQGFRGLRFSELGGFGLGVWCFGVQVQGSGCEGLGFRVSACAGLNIHALIAPSPLPGICGWRHVLRPANLTDIVQESIETGLSLKFPHLL